MRGADRSVDINSGSSMQHISARVTRLLAVFGVIISLVVLPALSPAAAKVTLPKTVPPVLQKTAKNVTADALPTVQINGVVWSQVIVGNKVFVGGSFSTARPAGAAPGTQTVSRKNLLDVQPEEWRAEEFRAGVERCGRHPRRLPGRQDAVRRRPVHQGRDGTATPVRRIQCRDRASCSLSPPRSTHAYGVSRSPRARCISAAGSPRWAPKPVRAWRRSVPPPESCGPPGCRRLTMRSTRW